MYRKTAAALAVSVALSLGGCASYVRDVIGLPSTDAKDACAWTTPRAYVACLDKAVAKVADDWVAASKAGKIPKEQYLAAEPAMDRVYKVLKESGAWLRAAEETRKIAADAKDENEKKAKEAAATALETLGIGRAATAESDINWLRDTLARATAPPAVVSPPPSAAVSPPVPLMPLPQPKIGG